MKLICICATYNRPRLLNHLVGCFENQDCDAATLLVLDDAGQYESQSGTNWRLYSQADRFPTLGAKRNALVELAADMHADAIAIWDDDDWYLPWAVRATIAAMEQAEWSRPSQVLRWLDNQLIRELTWHQTDQTDKAYQGGWAIHVDTFWRVGGYIGSTISEKIAI